MNSFFFENRLSLGPPLIRSIYEETDHWFLVKAMEKQECQIDLERKKRIIFGWKPPPISWLKCEIGSAWDKDRNQSGASWILSNADGKVMLHGRRSFSSINSRLEASFESWS